MDPNTALATLRDEDADRDERLDSGLALIRWIARGGYIPADLAPSHSRYAAARSLNAIVEVVELIEQTR